MESAPILEAIVASASGQRRIALLQAIDATGSIAKAARVVGLSYKGAWDAVEAINNIADGALVRRAVGGRGGGGTQLTERGRDLLALYEEIRAERKGALVRAGRAQRGSGGALPVLRRLAMLSSARNHFSGRVTRVRRGAVNDTVELETAGGSRIVATITRDSTELLRLRAGVPVTALVKASWIVLATQLAAPISCTADNQLRGTVLRVRPGAVNTEVVLDLPGDLTLAAIVSKDGARSLALKKGSAAVALFSAASVILVRLD